MPPEPSLEREPPQYNNELPQSTFPRAKTLDRAPSQYTLRTIVVADDSPEPSVRAPSPTEHTRLFGPFSRPGPAYGLNIRADAERGDSEEVNLQGYKRFKARRPLLVAAVQMAGIFIVAVVLMGGTLWLALPTLDEADRPMLRIPKSFTQLQDLRTLLQKYKTIYPLRTVICFVVTYLFLQAFSLPGSMYLSILAGAVWGMPRALPLCCACVATGATLCYAISSALGPALLTMPKWKARIDTWALKVEAQRANLLSFLIVLRIAPFPPHWVVNVVCPHLGIGVVQFWISTFLGMMGVTVIHTTIGGGLDQMTSAKDFKLISWRNALGLSAIVVAVLIPVGLRYYWRDELKSVAEVDEESNVALEGVIVASGPQPLVKKPDELLVLLPDDEVNEGEVEEFVDFEADEIPRGRGWVRKH